MSKTTQIAQQVTDIRKGSGFTQAEVAKKLGVSRQSWVMVEKGKRDLDTNELKRLAEIFGVDVVDFFRENSDIDKFKQMYFACLRFASDQRGGVPKTKLAKLLYLADFANFFYHLEPMSGVKYRRMQYGPVADLFFSLTEDLYEGGEINIQPMGEALIISASTRNQSNDRLNSQELKLIKEICSLWKTKRTKEIVNFTHEQKPWQMCRLGECIPYELIIQEDPKHVYQPVTR